MTLANMIMPGRWWGLESKSPDSPQRQGSPVAVLWLIQGPGLTYTGGPQRRPEQVGKQGLTDPPERRTDYVSHLFEPLGRLRRKDAQTG